MSIIASHFSSFCEIITGFLALIIQVGYLYRKKIRLYQCVLIAVATLPALYLSLESLNSFLTCDETYIIYEPVDLAGNSLLMWGMGAFRTTDLLIGFPLVGLKVLTGFSMDILAVAAKSLHWLLAFILIIAIIDLLVLIQGGKKFTWQYYVFSLYSYLLLPVMLLANKIINYDSFALLFGAVAILFLIAGWKPGQSRYLTFSVIAGMCAAQEKLIASPILYICLFAGAMKLTLNSCNVNKYPFLRASIINSSCLIIPVLLMSAVEHLLVALINTEGQPSINSYNLFYPLHSGFWPLLRIAGIDVTALSSQAILQQIWFIPIGAAVIITLYGGVTYIITRFYIVALQTRNYLQTISVMRHWLDRVFYMLFALCFVTGIFATYTIHAYLAPYYPVVPGTYVGYSFNNSSIYFGSSSVLSHILHYIGWAYATFSNSIPTITAVIALINLVPFMHNKKPHAPGLTIAAILALLVPFIYALFQIPVCNRYLNIFIYVTIIKISTDFLQITIPHHFRTLCTIIFTVVLIAEIFPFRPLYGAFRPVWSNYPERYNSTFSEGILNPWWMGWGEEVFLSGKKIQNHLKNENPTLLGIKLYHNYLGDWLLKKNNATIIFLDSAANVSYTENDYFILNRNALSQSSSKIPSLPPPFCTITYRGFTSAWVYRGDDIARHNSILR
jgi:hypothetical protein